MDKIRRIMMSLINAEIFGVEISSADFGELTNDEFFVTEEAAGRGVVVTNTSKTENIVMLKHFAENPDLPPLA